MNRPLAPRTFVILTALVGAVPSARAQDPPPAVLPSLLTLDETLAIFHAHGLDRLIAEAAVQSAEGDERAAGAVPNPGVQVGLYKSFFKGPQFDTDLGFFVGLSDSNALEDSLSGKRGLRLSVARAALAAARLGREDAERNLSFQVKSLYLQAAQARMLLDFARDVAAAATTMLELNQNKYRTGAISEIDVRRAEIDKLEADQAVDQAELSLRGAKIQLAFLLGVRQVVPDFAVDPKGMRFLIPPGLRGTTIDAMVREAIVRRPDLRAQERHRDRAEAQVGLSRRLRFPDFSLNAQYSQEGSYGGRSDGNGGTITAVSPPTLQLSLAGALPLFYQQQGEVRKAEADLRAQTVLRAKLEGQVYADVQTGWNAFVAGSRLVQRMETKLLDDARFVYEKVQVQFEKGAASQLDVRMARRAFIATNVEYIQDLANYWTAVFQLEQAVGMELRK